jgi:hypothetical protein
VAPTCVPKRVSPTPKGFLNEVCFVSCHCLSLCFQHRLQCCGDDKKMLVAATDTGFINNDLKYKWYEYMKTFKYCPVGKKATIPQCDSHASNCSMKLKSQMAIDKCHCIYPPSHSTHITQQCDQRGGPFQHSKLWGSLFLRVFKRKFGTWDKAHIARAIQWSQYFSLTPEICSRATIQVGWCMQASRPGLKPPPMSDRMALAKVLDYSPLSIQYIWERLCGAPKSRAGVEEAKRKMKVGPTEEILRAEEYLKKRPTLMRCLNALRLVLTKQKSMCLENKPLRDLAFVLVSTSLYCDFNGCTPTRRLFGM